MLISMEMQPRAVDEGVVRVARFRISVTLEGNNNDS